MTAHIRRTIRKSAQKKRLLGRKAVGVFLGLLFLTVTGGSLFCLRGSLGQKPGKRLTIVFNTRPILTTLFDQDRGELLFLRVPENTQIPVSGGYGFYPAVSLWPLAKQEKMGAALISKSFRELLGIPVDFAIDLSGEKIGDDDKTLMVRRFRRFCFECFFFGRDCGELSRVGAVEAWWNSRKISLNKVNIFSLELLPGLREDKLSDGSSVLVIDESSLDRFLSRYVFVEPVRREALSLGVFNATVYPGSARKAARVFSNLGGRVLLVEDWSEKLDKCELRADKQTRESFTYRLIKETLSCEDGALAGHPEVDLTILIGENYAGNI